MLWGRLQQTPLASALPCTQVHYVVAGYLEETGWFFPVAVQKHHLPHWLIRYLENTRYHGLPSQTAELHRQERHTKFWEHQSDDN